MRNLKKIAARMARGAATTALRRAIGLARRLHLLPPPGEALDTQEHFLIIALTPHLGDAVMLMPMIEALRRAHPEARIELAVEAGAAPLLQGVPALDKVHGLRLGAEPPSSPLQAAKRALLVVLSYWQSMRQTRPTVCLLPRWSDDLFRGHVLALLTGAPRRIGFSSDSDPGRPKAGYRDAFLTEAIRAGSGLHEPERFCLLLERAGLITERNAKGASTETVESLAAVAASVPWPALAQRLGIPAERPLAVVAPAASHPRREWPLERWAELVGELEARGRHVVLLGGPKDVALAQRLHALSGGPSTLAAGATSLRESATVIAHSTLLVGSDSGPGHLAGALGIPTVVLYASAAGDDVDSPSAPERVHPIGPRVEACRPTSCAAPCIGHCTAEQAHCIANISVSEVLKMVARAAGEQAVHGDRR